MEPVRLWRDADGTFWKADLWGGVEYAAIPRAQHDALVKRAEEAERERDEAVGRCPLCRSELDPDEMDPAHTGGMTELRPDGAGVCSECYCRWHDAPVYAKRAKDATARAERAEALLREAKGYVDSRDEWGRLSAKQIGLMRRIDAALYPAGKNPDDDDAKALDSALAEPGRARIEDVAVDLGVSLTDDDRDPLDMGAPAKCQACGHIHRERETCGTGGTPPVPTDADRRGVDRDAIDAARRLTDPEAAALEDNNP